MKARERKARGRKQEGQATRNRVVISMRAVFSEMQFSSVSASVSGCQSSVGASSVFNKSQF
jgi:hypothetical protein